MAPKPHPYFSSRGQIARERRLKQEFILGLCAPVIGVAAMTLALVAAPRAEPGSREERETRERSVYYPNCAAARSAGAAPIYTGSPGYREGLDGDNDGIACEPYRGF